MGHNSALENRYHFLRERLDGFATGAPESEHIIKILKILYKPEEADLAAKVPRILTPLTKIAQKLKMPREEAEERLNRMSERGLLFDVTRNGERYFMMAPIVIGFYEYTFMRAHEDLPLGELATLFENYLQEKDGFMSAIFRGSTQIGRTLVNEDVLPDDGTEVLDWERASELLKGAEKIGLSLCTCKHKASHLGKEIKVPQEVCFTLGYAADMMFKWNAAKPISVDDALSILGKSKEMGMMQTADNVQSKPTYLCNCDKPNCTMLSSIRHHNIKNSIVTSNWIMKVNRDKCKGCGLCAKACPVEAISVQSMQDGDRKVKWASCNEELCLGCGLCANTCKNGSAHMVARSKRVYTPDTIFEKLASMAIERGKLADFIFDDPETLTHRAVSSLVKLMEKTPPYKIAMAVGPLKSIFLNKLAKEARKISGSAADIIG